MKLLAPIAAIIAAASASQIYNTAPHQESYANSAEVYQSQLEYQQHGLYSDQSQAYTGHESAYQGQPSGEKTAKILSFISENDGHGYQYSYETENGIKAQEVGQTVKGSEAHGAYSYKGDDGQTYSITYTADEHGFRPQGAHLPTPPPIPEAIAKAIEQNEKDEAAGIFDDGKYVEQHNEVEDHHIENNQAHQSQIHQAQIDQAHFHQAQIHQAQIHQAQSHQSQIHQPQYHQAQVHQPQYHQTQVHQSQIHQTQSLQHSQQHQPSQVYQISSPVYHYEPTSFHHNSGYGGQAVSSEPSYHKH